MQDWDNKHPNTDARGICTAVVQLSLQLTLSNPGALVISLCSLHQGWFIGGETLSTGFSSGKFGDRETTMAIRLSPA